MKTCMIGWLMMAAVVWADPSQDYPPDLSTVYGHWMETSALAGDPAGVVEGYDRRRHLPPDVFTENTESIDHLMDCMEVAFYRQPIRQRIDALRKKMGLYMIGSIRFEWNDDDQIYWPTYDPNYCEGYSLGIDYGCCNDYIDVQLTLLKGLQWPTLYPAIDYPSSVILAVRNSNDEISAIEDELSKRRPMPDVQFKYTICHRIR